MADKAPKDQKQPQQQGPKKKGSYAVYAATGRELTNKRRNAARDARRQAADAVKRPARALKRAYGSLARLDRRLNDAKGYSERTRLAHVRMGVMAMVERREAEAA